ncbi:hypothetical protein C0991_004584 [Blastosporella zonata]|nr:hypothetical protein C0991_004584 [Blastosporella zonata]
MVVEIERTARAALTVLKDHHLQACLVGSAACAIYGMKNRVPNVWSPFFDSTLASHIDDRQDVDIIVVTDMDPEHIKRLFVAANSAFYLRPSINPQNSYRVLWFTISFRRSCKVDILIPSLFSLPKIPENKIAYITPSQDMPVVAFLVLLLLKLKAWADHRVDVRQHMLDKVVVDSKDINELVILGVTQYHAHLGQETWLPNGFKQESKERVHIYKEQWPESKRFWRAMGL